MSGIRREAFTPQGIADPRQLSQSLQRMQEDQRQIAAALTAQSASSAPNILTGAYADRPTPGTPGRLYMPADDFVPALDTGTAWRAFGPVYPVQAPPAASDPGWSWRNQGTMTATQANGALYVYAPPNAGAAALLRPSAGAAAFVEAAWFSEHALEKDSSGTSTFPFIGLTLFEVASGKGYTISAGANLNNNQYQFYIHTSIATWTGSAFTTASGHDFWELDPRGPLFLRLRRSGTSVVAEYSRTRSTWTVVDTVTNAAIGFTSPDRAGLWFNGSDVLAAYWNVFHMAQS